MEFQCSNATARFGGVEFQLRFNTTEFVRTLDVITKMYLVELVDRTGKRKIVKASGLDSVTGKLPAINYGKLKSEFSPQVHEKWGSLISRPPGVAVDMLMGSDAIDLHPVQHETRANMMAWKSRFGVGYMMNGTSPEIKAMHHLHFAETTGAWFRHTANPLKHAQDGTLHRYPG